MKAHLELAKKHLKDSQNARNKILRSDHRVVYSWVVAAKPLGVAVVAASLLGGAVVSASLLGGAVVAGSPLGGAVVATSPLGGVVTAISPLGGAVAAASLLGAAVVAISPLGGIACITAHLRHLTRAVVSMLMCIGIARILKLCARTIGISIGMFAGVNSRKNYLAKQTNSQSRCISYDHIGKYVCCIATSLCVCLNIQ